MKKIILGLFLVLSAQLSFAHCWTCDVPLVNNVITGNPSSLPPSVTPPPPPIHRPPPFQPVLPPIIEEVITGIVPI